MTQHFFRRNGGVWRRAIPVVALLALPAVHNGCFGGTTTEPSGVRALPTSFRTGGPQPGELPTDVRGTTIPAELFGMHLVRVWLAGVKWPSVPVGVYRMVNATPRWDDLHLAHGRWAEDPGDGTGMGRIEAVLHFRDLYGPGTPTMYTLGGGLKGGFPRWLGPARADTIAEWRNFVRNVATRFNGRVRYWQIWNEADAYFYNGTNEQLVALTRAASEELRRVNPGNIVIAPSFTEFGLGRMETFYAAGGGRYVDIVAWHQDNKAVPETDTVKILQVRSMMRKHGVGHLPLWTTEGHSRLGAGADPAGVVARTYLVLWAYGVKSFIWYSWDISDYDLPGPWITLTERDRPDIPTAAGRAYGEIARWLIGAQMLRLDIEDDTWTVELRMASGGIGWIVWQTGSTHKTFDVPDAVSVKRELDGSTTTWPGGPYSLTHRPVLFLLPID